eukprot:3121343-Amphidinium_carterae.5
MDPVVATPETCTSYTGSRGRQRGPETCKNEGGRVCGCARSTCTLGVEFWRLLALACGSFHVMYFSGPWLLSAWPVGLTKFVGVDPHGFLRPAAGCFTLLVTCNTRKRWNYMKSFMGKA